MANKPELRINVLGAMQGDTEAQRPFESNTYLKNGLAPKDHLNG